MRVSGDRFVNSSDVKKKWVPHGPVSGPHSFSTKRVKRVADVRDKSYYIYKNREPRVKKKDIIKKYNLFMEQVW